MTADHDPVSVQSVPYRLYYCVSDTQVEMLDQADATQLRQCMSRRDLMVLKALLTYATETVDEALSGIEGL